MFHKMSNVIINYNSLSTLKTKKINFQFKKKIVVKGVWPPYIMMLDIHPHASVQPTGVPCPLLNWLVHSITGHILLHQGAENDIKWYKQQINLMNWIIIKQLLLPFTVPHFSNKRTLMPHISWSETSIPGNLDHLGSLWILSSIFSKIHNINKISITSIIVKIGIWLFKPWTTHI